MKCFSQCSWRRPLPKLVQGLDRKPHLKSNLFYVNVHSLTSEAYKSTINFMLPSILYYDYERIMFDFSAVPNVLIIGKGKSHFSPSFVHISKYCSVWNAGQTIQINKLNDSKSKKLKILVFITRKSLDKGKDFLWIFQKRTNLFIGRRNTSTFMWHTLCDQSFFFILHCHEQTEQY